MRLREDDLVIFDRYLDIVRREEFSLRQVEALYRKEAVCDPGCVHAPSDSYCSRHSSQRLDPPTTGREDAEGGEA